MLAAFAQKKRMRTRSKKTLATKDKKLYPARSNRYHNVEDDTSSAAAPRQFFHNTTSATNTHNQIE